jgi:hypothetical protein
MFGKNFVEHYGVRDIYSSAASYRLSCVRAQVVVAQLAAPVGEQMRSEEISRGLKT